MCVTDLLAISIQTRDQARHPRDGSRSGGALGSRGKPRGLDLFRNACALRLADRSFHESEDSGLAALGSRRPLLRGCGVAACVVARDAFDRHEPITY